MKSPLLEQNQTVINKSRNVMSSSASNSSPVLSSPSIARIKKATAKVLENRRKSIARRQKSREKSSPSDREKNHSSATKTPKSSALATDNLQQKPEEIGLDVVGLPAAADETMITCVGNYQSKPFISGAVAGVSSGSVELTNGGPPLLKRKRGRPPKKNPNPSVVVTTANGGDTTVVRRPPRLNGICLPNPSVNNHNDPSSFDESDANNPPPNPPPAKPEHDDQGREHAVVRRSSSTKRKLSKSKSSTTTDANNQLAAWNTGGGLNEEEAEREKEEEESFKWKAAETLLETNLGNMSFQSPSSSPPPSSSSSSTVHHHNLEAEEEEEEKGDAEGGVEEAGNLNCDHEILITDATYEKFDSNDAVSASHENPTYPTESSPNLPTTTKFEGFEAGDLVWAQFATYPSWPAIIRVHQDVQSITDGKNQINCQFLLDGNSAWVKKWAIHPYDSFDQQEERRIEMVKKCGKNKHLLKKFKAPKDKRRLHILEGCALADRILREVPFKPDRSFLVRRRSTKDPVLKLFSAEEVQALQDAEKEAAVAKIQAKKSGPSKVVGKGQKRKRMSTASVACPQENQINQGDDQLEEVGEEEQLRPTKKARLTKKTTKSTTSSDSPTLMHHVKPQRPLSPQPIPMKMKETDNQFLQIWPNSIICFGCENSILSTGGGGRPRGGSSGGGGDPSYRKCSTKGCGRTFCSDCVRVLNEDPSAAADGGRQTTATASNGCTNAVTIPNNNNNHKQPFLCDVCRSDSVCCEWCHEEVTDRTDKASYHICSHKACAAIVHSTCARLHHSSLYSSGKNYQCPRHQCGTCVAKNEKSIQVEERLECIRCCISYHADLECVPAGCRVLNQRYLVCPRHFNVKDAFSKPPRMNVDWCLHCSNGGTLVLCENCSCSYHENCIDADNKPSDQVWICEDCKSGIYPLYDQIVWAKYGSYRWWPSKIMHPDKIPDSIERKQHSVGEFVVRFYGSGDYAWLSHRRVFLFGEGTLGNKKSTTSSLGKAYVKAVEEATAELKEQKEKVRLKGEVKDFSVCANQQPSSYKSIDKNELFGACKVRGAGELKALIDDDNPPSFCSCREDQEPCTSDNTCLNRAVLVECDPLICPMGLNGCGNRRFQGGHILEGHVLSLFKTSDRGFGLRTLAPIPAGKFIIEYTGEIIDQAECEFRIRRQREEGKEEFYMLSLERDKYIDAGPKGNLSRFINHSCDPNCETQAWVVKGQRRIGVFAAKDINACEELSFHYNFDYLSAESDRIKCACGGDNCVGFIGREVKQRGGKSSSGTTSSATAANRSQQQKSSSKKKRRSAKASGSAGGAAADSAGENVQHESFCFHCRSGGDLILCDRPGCPKVYHLVCVHESQTPRGRWECPHHYCNLCKTGKLATTLCHYCPNSFCDQHVAGEIAKDKHGHWICEEHEFEENEMPEVFRQNQESTSTTAAAAADIPKHLDE